jgi:hypothetical protein
MATLCAFVRPDLQVHEIFDVILAFWGSSLKTSLLNLPDLVNNKGFQNLKLG